MPGFTDPFGGSTLQAAQVAYRVVALTADVTLVWPANSQSATDYVARIMDVTATGAYAITLPDATLVSPGQDVFFANRGAQAFTVKDAAGNALATIAAGAIRYFYLQVNTTAAGAWASVLFGALASTLDASQLAGYGLRTVGNTLAVGANTSTFSANYSVLAADATKVFVWTGGSGTLTLPSLSAVQPTFEIEVRNQGTGTLTVTTADGSQVDAASSIALQVTESCFVHSGPTAWYTVGRGRNTQFNFTKLTKNVTGGTTTLSLTEAANVVQSYSGTLAATQYIVVPAVVQVYYIINGTTGAYTFTVKSPVAGGATVNVSSGSAAILFCDGTNIINCTTSGAISANTSLPSGTVSAPPLNFAADPTTGMYQAATGEIDFTVSGTRRFKVDSSGVNATNLSLAGALTTTGGALSIALGGATNVTLPTSGTLVAAGAVTGSGLTQSSGKLLGRSTASTGAIEEITVGSGLSLSGGTISSTAAGGSVTTVSITSANGLGGTVANATTTPAITLTTSVSGLVKGNATAFSAAVAGTDYAPPTSGSSILYGNGSGGFSNVTVGSGLSFSGGTLASTGGTSAPTQGAVGSIVVAASTDLTAGNDYPVGTTVTGASLVVSSTASGSAGTISMSSSSSTGTAGTVSASATTSLSYSGTWRLLARVAIGASNSTTYPLGVFQRTV